METIETYKNQPKTQHIPLRQGIIIRILVNNIDDEDKKENRDGSHSNMKDFINIPTLNIDPVVMKMKLVYSNDNMVYEQNLDRNKINIIDVVNNYDIFKNVAKKPFKYASWEAFEHSNCLYVNLSENEYFAYRSLGTLFWRNRIGQVLYIGKKIV
ncbi:hypothetical protein BJ944DRAFT_236090 [Cunninghamella echinulata]|nr:hypothetical protein BJ944DRAFT_236090 [Cunninghamella echinulata]